MDYEIKEFLFTDFDKVRNAWIQMADVKKEEEVGKYQRIITACGLHLALSEFEKLVKEKETTISQGQDLFFEVLWKNKVFFSTSSKDYLEKMKEFLKSVLPKETSSQPSQPEESPPPS